ncbi:MAG: hypothetical protein JRH06_09180 [Deltaproteobacteria bacterium]|nr:hypothetical protein [Deltaproteobacteria bacterium]MBW2137717.1 hypothetical protein [Deltaproteobacteria bacterium]
MDPRAVARLSGRIFFTIALFGILMPPGARAQKEHIVYFPNTAYELNVYKIRGKHPGKTLMLIGGIQGNEPGGFLSADLYADMRLERGNLVVVPRANFYSIILNKRGHRGDMNRKFTHEDNTKSMEDRIVNILKKLISESDYLLNLHDGAGYYHPRYINKWRNPMRFGQSIIADCDVYRVPGTDKTLRLGDMARGVIEEVNLHIQNELYKFHFMNTRTFHNDSPHREQRKSATFYALVRHNIPAFGVETSKFLPTIDLKVRYHNLVINTFMRHFGIVPESPGLILDPPKLKYLVLSINGQIPVVIKERQAIRLEAGDRIHVSHIEANYERGLSLDILGYGSLNDYRKDFSIFRDTSLIVRKDNIKFAEIPIKITKRTRLSMRRSPVPDRISGFIVETRGTKILVANGETLHLVKGEKLKILDVLPLLPPSSGVKVNFKGFVGERGRNTGEDRGYVIDTGRDLIKRYSLKKRGESYRVLVTRQGKVIGRMRLKLSRPRLDFMVLKVNDRHRLFVSPEDKLHLSRKDTVCLEEIRTNLRGGADGIHVSINGHKWRPGEVRRLSDLYHNSRSNLNQAVVKKGSLSLGRVYFLLN